MARADFAFHHRFRIRYAECDPQGVVFNSRYLEFADAAMSEFWRSRGLSLSPSQFETHVAQALVQFMKPIRFDEEIDGLVRVDRFGRTSLTQHIELHAAGSEDLRARIELVHVHVDLATSQPKVIPQTVRQALGEGDEGQGNGPTLDPDEPR